VGASQRADLHYLPLTVAEQLGFFRAEGLEVELVEGPADVQCGPYEHTIQQQAQGRFLQSIVVQARTPALALGVSPRAVPQFRSLVDLRGRRIGIAAPGTPSHLVAKLALLRAGVDPADVQFVVVGGTASATLALRSGQVDALCKGEPAMTMLEQRAEVRIVSDTRTLKGTQALFGGPLPAACLYAPTEFIQRHPATCQALAHAIVHALKWLQTAGPQDILRTVPEAYLQGDRALYLASFEKVRESLSVDGLLPLEGARTALRALAAFDPALRLERIDLARTYTNEFAQRARERFRA
jgi:NitT/TauT family transport system substrate-binding protein